METPIGSGRTLAAYSCLRPYRSQVDRKGSHSAARRALDGRVVHISVATIVTIVTYRVDRAESRYRIETSQRQGRRSARQLTSTLAHNLFHS